MNDSHADHAAATPEEEALAQNSADRVLDAGRDDARIVEENDAAQREASRGDGPLEEELPDENNPGVI